MVGTEVLRVAKLQKVRRFVVRMQLCRAEGKVPLAASAEEAPNDRIDCKEGGIPSKLNVRRRKKSRWFSNLRKKKNVF